MKCPSSTPSAPLVRSRRTRAGTLLLAALLITSGCGGNGGGAQAAPSEKSFLGDLFGALFMDPTDIINDSIDETLAQFNNVEQSVGLWRGDFHVMISECSPVDPGTTVSRTLDVKIFDDEVLVTDEGGRVYRTEADAFLSFTAEWADLLSPAPQSGYINFMYGSGDSDALVTIHDDLVIDGESCAQQYQGSMYRVLEPPITQESNP